MRLGLLVAVLVASVNAQELRYPANAHAGLCLAWGADWRTTADVAAEGNGAVRARFTVTNRCANRVSVSGLEPATEFGAAIVQNAPIEVATISAWVDETHILSGTAQIGGFDVPAGATVEQEALISLTSGIASDVVAATVHTYSHDGGSVYLDDVGQVSGLGNRTICVHYADRPCGEYQ